MGDGSIMIMLQKQQRISLKHIFFTSIFLTNKTKRFEVVSDANLLSYSLTHYVHLGFQLFLGKYKLSHFLTFSIMTSVFWGFIKQSF